MTLYISFISYLGIIKIVIIIIFKLYNVIVNDLAKIANKMRLK
jgi:hypothetical protein